MERLRRDARASDAAVASENDSLKHGACPLLKLREADSQLQKNHHCRNQA